MLIFNVTKRINRAVAPKLLKWSLRMHESLSSSSSVPIISPNYISLLPLAQRLVSIEVLQLAQGKGGQKSNSDSFIDQTWNLLFEGRQKKLQAKQEDQAEAEAQRLWEAKQQKRQKRRQQRRNKSMHMNGNDDQDKELFELGDRRVELLEQYIRPALLPTQKSHSRHLFTHHHQQKNPESTNYYDNFVKWIRGEYLVAKYGLVVQRAVRQHPELRDDAAGLSTLEVEMEESPIKLPSVNTVREAFGMQDWNRRKVPYSSWGDDAGKLVSTDGNANNLNIQQIIHQKLRGQIAHSGPLNAFFEMRRREDSYELWTREYIFGLAKYLLDRIAEMDRQQGAQQTDTIILDVGAGDGRLAYFLRRAMKEQKQIKSPSSQQVNLPTIIATDDGSWKAPLYSNRHIQVEQLSAIESLQKYAKYAGEGEGNEKTRLIVLCSWMPPGQDWTVDFRRPMGTPTGTAADAVERLVEEYILIGEADDGTCGHNWYTWGNPAFLDSEYEEEQRVAPYRSDGYTRVDLEELSLLQFSRFDCKRSSESMTVSFRRGS